MINPRNFKSSNRITKTTNPSSSDPHSQAHPPEPDFVPPQINIEGPHVSTTQPTMLYRIPNPLSANSKGIILANLSAMVEDPPINDDPLNATDEVMNEDEDIDMYLNIHNIEDIEMSTDSSKRKGARRGRELPPSSVRGCLYYLNEFFYE